MLNSILEKLRTAKSGLLLAGALLAGQPAHAFQLSPIVMDFAPSGREASRAFRVQNDSDERVAVQISMLKRDMLPDGQEVNADGSDDFVVHPSQILLGPKETQTIRVRWIGHRTPDQELAYRILAEQLPVNLTREKPTGAKIDILVRYLGSVYVVPKGARSNIVLDALTEQRDAAGNRQLAIMLHNRGSSRAVLRHLRLRLQAGGQAIELGPDDLKGMAGENILAGKKRQFILPRPAALPEGPIQCSFEFKRRPGDSP